MLNVAYCTKTVILKDRYRKFDVAGHPLMCRPISKTELKQ